PTPHEKVPLTLSGNSNLEVLSEGFIPGSIPPGQELASVQPLRFKFLAPESHADSHPYERTINVQAFANNVRLNRPYTSTLASLSVRYPVALQGQPTHYTIASGDNLVLQASLKNLASKVLGGNAGREIVVEI